MAKKAKPRLSETVNFDQHIEVIGAREHNLKNISVSIPKNKLVVITGVSGSGKSSLAFDTIYNEGQRRYMETFGMYARQFAGTMEKPDVDSITGLSPVISIEQKTTSKNPRSTVGTITEIYDFLRLLYARVSEAYSYNTGKPMVKFSEDEIVQTVFTKYKGKKISVLAPLVIGRKGHYRELFEDLRKKGYVKVRVDGVVTDLVERMQVDRYKLHNIELVVDRLAVTNDIYHRLSQSIAQALKMGNQMVYILDNDTNEATHYSKLLMCADTGISYDEPNPNSFSFNSPYGYCPTCKGTGEINQVNLAAVIPDREKSIAEGGIAPLGEEREAQVYQQAKQFAKKNKISVDQPLKNLTEAQINLMLYGKETVDIDNEIDVDVNTSVGNEGGQSFYSAAFEGVVVMLKKWYNANTITEYIHEWMGQFMHLKTCPTCNGARLKKESLWFWIAEKSIFELAVMDLATLGKWFDDLPAKLNAKQKTIATDVLKEITDRLKFLLDVGLHYLSLNRSAKSLSGGEQQRIKLATQIGSQLQGITYVLDEPSIGLHQRDNHRLIKALENLRDIGNSLLVVEHDRDIMLAADYVIDIGPKAGKYGGQIVAQGTPTEILKQLNSETTQFLNGQKNIPIPKEVRQGSGQQIVITEASGNNLKNVTAEFPLGKFIVVTGVSGSGKSSLITETLYPILANHCYNSRQEPLPYKAVSGLELIDKVIEVDQSPIGRTPRSNPATYCGFFTDIRTLFAQVPEAKIRGYNAGRFSFNVKTGRCPVCEGGGMRVIEMNFLPDVYVLCEKCNGKRYNRETLEIRYKGKSISDVLDMSVDEAVEFFQPVPYIYRKIKVLQDVGLGYITLGQSAVTLSGGEAQRVKLATELGKKDTGKTFYILDEPTTGLHFQDVQMLIQVLNKLVDRGNTVLVIEHHLDVIKIADYVIDLGPDGGSAGGEILYQGAIKELVKIKRSETAPFIQQEIDLQKKLAKN